MRKPQDPRKHGLNEPKQVFSKTDRIYLSDLGEKYKITLQAVIGAWNKVVKDIESQGYRIIEAPYFSSSSFYGNGAITLMYSYEWDNLNYSVEKAAYDAEIASYEAALAIFNEWEATEAKKPPSLEKKIERAKQRLANLEAARDGQPLPFPE